MTPENPQENPPKLTPEYRDYKPEISSALVENRDGEMKDATETERNIASALSMRFESALLQMMKRTRSEEGKVDRELNEAVSDLLTELDKSAHMGSSEEERYSTQRTKAFIDTFNETSSSLRRDMGIEK